MTTILLVEDEKSLSEPLAYLLRREGYEVSIVDNGPAALEMVDQSPPDLMLLDLMLPGLAGTEVCREVRTKSSLPIIMLTAKDSEIDIVVGRALGAADSGPTPESSRVL
jgi:two-component system response regulator RegX3